MIIKVAQTYSIMRRIYQLPLKDTFLLIEALCELGLASMVIAILPFRYVTRLLVSTSRKPQISATEREARVKRVRWAVSASARYLPLRAMCFEQGLAAYRMLRRRGVPSVLYFGAARDDEKSLIAHVWVRAGTLDVVGCETAANFVTLVEFPQNTQSVEARKLNENDAEEGPRNSNV